MGLRAGAGPQQQRSLGWLGPGEKGARVGSVWVHEPRGMSAAGLVAVSVHCSQTLDTVLDPSPGNLFAKSHLWILDW